MSSNQKKSEISFFNANFTTIISVSLVLLLFGLVAFSTVAGYSLTKNIKENIGFTVVINDGTTDEEISNFDKMWKGAPYVSTVKYLSKEDALKEWEKETGEDLVELLGANPLSAEFDVRVKAEYASTDSLKKIISQLEGHTAIESISMQQDIVDAVNNNISKVAIILGVIALIFTIISFALINNTIRLTVHSKRFIIHTMKLVGAKSSFIRKPFIISSVINGFIAGILACLLLFAIMYYGQQVEISIKELIPVESVFAVFGGLLILGMLLCAWAAFMASSKYIKLDYDSLFKR